MPTSDHGYPVAELSDEQLAQLRRDVLHEQSLRRRLDASPEKIEHAIAEYQKATGKGSGESWVQPTGPLNAYRKGAVVEHEGEEWVSTTPNNVWEPPSGWRLRPLTDPETGEEIPPPFVPPTGNHDSYQEGERITWSDGLVYEAVRSGVVHSPDEYAADWRLIEPEPEPPEDEEPDPEEPTDPGEPDPEEPSDGDGDGDEDDEPEPEPEPEPEEEQPDEWVQPGGHNPYNTGDRVLWQGSVYESVMDGNVWSPTDHSAGWKLVN